MSGACQVYCCFKLACDVTDFEAYWLYFPDRYNNEWFTFFFSLRLQLEVWLAGGYVPKLQCFPQPDLF
jgi:hypothetical protein